MANDDSGAAEFYEALVSRIKAEIDIAIRAAGFANRLVITEQHVTDLAKRNPRDAGRDEAEAMISSAAGAAIVGIHSVMFDSERGELWVRLTLADGSVIAAYWTSADLLRFMRVVQPPTHRPLGAVVQ